MAFGDDEEERRRQGMAPGVSLLAGLGGGAGPAPAAPTPRGSGFVNLETILGANRGMGEAMAGRVGGLVEQQGQQAEALRGQLQAEARRSPAASLQDVNPELYGRAQDAASEAAASARGAGTAGGVGGLLSQVYGAGGGYGSGARGFDTFLTRAAGGGQLEGLGRRYGGLQDALGTASQQYQPSAANAPTFGGVTQFSPPGMTMEPGEVRRRKRDRESGLGGRGGFGWSS